VRKTRSDNKLLNLPEEQQAQLAEWLLSGLPYHKARELVDKEFGVQVGLTSFTGFWNDVCSAALIARRAQAVTTAGEVAQAAAASPGQFDAATIDALKQKAFELSISPAAKPGEVKALFMLVLKARDQDLVERRVKLLEQKAAQAEQAGDVLRSSLTPEQQQARLKEIFGMG
jgi:hypothetical protein